MVATVTSCALLAGCGSSTSEASDPAPAAPVTSTATPPLVSDSPSASASDPANASTPATPSGSTPPSVDPSPGAVESDEVAILSATAADGQVDEQAVALTDDATVQTFVADLDARLANRVSRVVARTDVPVGRTLWGAVVSVGCDTPTGVVVTSSDDGVRLQAQPGKQSTVQCFAPVTSVALVLVTDQ